MQQSNVIFGMLLLAFIVFITTKGELPSYITLLRGGSAGGSAPASDKPANAITGELGQLPDLFNLPPPSAGAEDFLTALTH